MATIRKLLLTSVLAIMRPGTYEQIIIGIAIVVAFWRVESNSMPFFYHQVRFCVFTGLGRGLGILHQAALLTCASYYLAANRTMLCPSCPSSPPWAL